ncbi:hypothetical protein BN961_00508 [Afipia felis]|uniref:Uncharacterized protein n=1 Tax=Afipia felis TaxID=1035 RepID=A0A090MLD0_AFIFE|nr:hypothetical protein BN961_00508 [Afipia felis]
MQERFDLARELLREVLQLRAEPRFEPLSRPDQFLAERRQRRAAAALALDERRAEECRPLLDQIPDVPVRQIGVRGGAGEFSGLPNLIEDAKHDDGSLWAAFFTKSPDRFDFDMKHRASLMYLCSYAGNACALDIIFFIEEILLP